MPPVDETQLISVAELALMLHQGGTGGLSIPIPNGKEVDFGGAAEHPASVEDAHLRFKCLEDINAIVASDILAKLRAEGSVEADSLFKAAYSLWRHEIGHSDMASGRLLANATEVDVLQLAADRISKGAQVFDVLHLVQAFLLSAKALDTESLILLNDAQYERTRGDMAVGMLFSSIEIWMSSHAEKAALLTNSLLSDELKSRENLLGAVWMGWFKSNSNAAATKLLDVTAPESDVQVAALSLRVAARMLHSQTLDAEYGTKLRNLISANLLSPDSTKRMAAVGAATQLIHLTTEFDEHLSALAIASNQDVLAHLAVALGRYSQELLDGERYFYWLNRCRTLEPTYKGAIDFLQYPLASLITPNSAHCNAALDFLRTWVLAQPHNGPNNRQFTEIFSQCTSQILSDPDLFADWLTSWLLGEDTKLPSSAAGVLSTVSGRRSASLKFSKSILDGLNQAELMFLTRRLLGYVHDADQLLSLALSLLLINDSENRVWPFMRSLLVDEIGYDYPTSTIEAVEKVAEKATSGRDQQVLNSICLEIERQMKELEKLPRLNELKPPSTLQMQFSLARRRQMNEATKEAEKGSIIQQLVSKTYIKAGHTSFQYQRDAYTEPMQMKSFSHMIQLPRREILDPVGNAIRMYILRNAKRDEK
ncbi:MAG: hypothetical protein V4858_23005 [Pseudomonadota bacterium]